MGKRLKFQALVTIIENKAIKNRNKYISKLKLEIPEIKHFSIANMKNGFSALIDVSLSFNNMQAHTDAVIRLDVTSKNTPQSYIPVLIIVLSPFKVQITLMTKLVLIVLCSD